MEILPIFEEPSTKVSGVCKTNLIERFSKAGNIWKEFRQNKGENENNSPVKIIKKGQK